MSADVKFEEKVVVSLQPPKLWKVVFLNDDHTPMEFVIELLMSIFRHDVEGAKNLTLEIHESGSAVAGVYPFEVAEQRSVEATNLSRSNGFPLRIQVEEE